MMIQIFGLIDVIAGGAIVFGMEGWIVWIGGFVLLKGLYSIIAGMMG